jgi:putative ABC transport system substrate-binding protein
MGKSLADLATTILNSEGDSASHGMMPLRDVQSAVNLRTAKHLGINTGRQAGFDIAFPEQ